MDPSRRDRDARMERGCCSCTHYDDNPVNVLVSMCRCTAKGIRANAVRGSAADMACYTLKCMTAIEPRDIFYDDFLYFTYIVPNVPKILEELADRAEKEEDMGKVFEAVADTNKQLFELKNEKLLPGINTIKFISLHAEQDYAAIAFGKKGLEASMNAVYTNSSEYNVLVYKENVLNEKYILSQQAVESI